MAVRASVVVCDSCNEIAMLAMEWVQDEPGHETLVCKCGENFFTLLELDEEMIPEGALVVERQNVSNTQSCD